MENHHWFVGMNEEVTWWNNDDYDAALDTYWILRWIKGWISRIRAKVNKVFFIL